MAPLIERNAAPRRHPGAEGESYPPAPSDALVMRAIRGRGLVATITPTFAVAVIVGVVTTLIARRPAPVTDEIGTEAHRCNESLTQLRADFSQFKAETSLHNQIVENRINDLLSRSVRTTSEDFEPSQLAPKVSRALRGQ